MQKILAIGGAVIKTAQDKLYKIIEKGEIECLIHNGGSLFHDFQRVLDPNLKNHSYALEDLLTDCKVNESTSQLVWKWVNKRFDPSYFINLKIEPPLGSVTRLCEDMKIPVFLFTIPGADFWHIFFKDWASLARCSEKGFDWLVERFKTPFHFINMGSAVVHPEVFIKAIAVAKPMKGSFRGDVVDFLDMYRPRTRVAKYGRYFQMTHAEYLDNWLKEIENERSERTL